MANCENTVKHEKVVPVWIVSINAVSSRQPVNVLVDVESNIDKYSNLLLEVQRKSGAATFRRSRVVFGCPGDGRLSHSRVIAI